ncbi:MAG: DUF6599 family protein [Thermoanaerobaculales bacterium]
MRRLLALAVLLAGRAALGGDISLLPTDGVLPAWTADSRAKVFTGSALYGHIDGGAEIFFEFGFEELTVQRYDHGADAIEVELYRMRDAAAALGIYLGRCGRETPDPSLPGRNTAGAYQVLLAQNRYLLIVSDFSGNGQLAQALVALARAIATRLPLQVAVPTLDVLPREGRLAGSERLIRGPLALQSLITLGDGDVLQLGDTITAAAASYAEGAGHPAHALILAVYPSEAAAGMALRFLTSHLDAEIKPLRTGNGFFVFRDYAGKFGVVRVEGASLSVTINLATEPHLR